MTQKKGLSMSENPEQQDDLQPEMPSDNVAEGGTAPDGAQDEVRRPMGIDWRIAAIIGLAVVFLIAAYINKKYYGGKKKPSLGAPRGEAGRHTPEEGKPATPQRKLTREQRYGLLLRQKRMETTETVFMTRNKQLILAMPPVPIADRKNPRRIVGLAPGRLFDLTNRKKGLGIGMLNRRPGPQGRGILYANGVLPLGVDRRVKLVFKPARDVTAEVVADGERVIGVHMGDEFRAYPVKFLNFHEVVNDTLGGKPVLVSWCPFADAASAMVRNPVGEGKDPLVFGVSGLMLQGSTVLYDFQTESLWWPVRHECIAGKLLNTPQTAVRTVVTTWKTWKTRHPETAALAGTDPASKFDYSKTIAAFEEYLKNRMILFPVYGLDITKSPMTMKALVFGVIGADGKAARAYNAGLLRRLDGAETSFKDTLGDAEITLAYDKTAGILNATDANGKPLFTESMLWAAWFGAHPKTEVWREKELRENLEKANKLKLSDDEPLRLHDTPTSP